MKIGERYLITTDEWFFAPDGNQYKAVFGTLHGVFSDKNTFGIETNSKSTNWYAQIGHMIVAGCQIHYAIQADMCNLERTKQREIEHDGRLVLDWQPSRIYDAGD